MNGSAIQADPCRLACIRAFFSSSEQSNSLGFDLSVAGISPTLFFSVAALIYASLLFLNWSVSYEDGIPVVNRKFALEPRIFSRWRWAFDSIKILDAAHQKYHGQTYRLARGDVDVLVFPKHLIPELNKLNETNLNSHKYQCHSISGHLNELDIILQSNLHMKLMLNRGTTALPILTKPLSERAEIALQSRFNASETAWEEAQPLPRIAQCVSQLLALVLLGAPACDNPKLSELSPRLTQKAFSVAFAVRLIPTFLENILLWLLPPKWNLGKTWCELDDIVVPELKRRQAENDHGNLGSVASWMLSEAKSTEADPNTITRLIGSAFAGGIWSTSTLIFGVVVGLVSRPEILAQVREEIRQKHIGINGQWDYTAFNSLGKLDSAMKETSRIAPGSLLVYGRVVEQDYRLSNGVMLRKGQHIATPLHTNHADTSFVPDPKAYDPLRWYNADREGHLRAPFTSLNEHGRWGAGRRACPGRFLASISAKIMLVKLLDEYDFEFVRGKRPHVQNLHEFVYIHPSSRIRMRSRPEKLGISYECQT